MDELNHLKNVFQVNGYPFRLVTRTMNRQERQQTAERNTDQERQKLCITPM